MSGNLRIPSLGRPFNLGMLYDCRTEKLLPGITLWGSHKLKSASQVEKQPSSSYKIITEDSIREKTTTLGVDANVKISLLCDLVKVHGAAKYLGDHKTSKKQSRVTLQYTSTTHFEQLTMDQIGAIQFPDVLNDQDATHVVTGIQYGADAFFVFDRSLEGAETMHDVQGKMEAAVRSIPCLSKIISPGAGASMSFKHFSKTETDRFRCTFHGDLILSSNPSSFDEAINLYKDLPKLLTDGGSVPKVIFLAPLSKLRKVKSQQIISAISFDLTLQVEKLMEQFHDTEMCINDLLNHDICSKFVDIKSQLNKLKDLLARFKMRFIKNLARILPKVRSAGEKEEKLAELISSVHASPFSSSAMGKNLRDKEKEINYLAQCLKNTEKDPKIRYDFPNTDCHLAGLQIDFEIDQVVCFGFNVTSDTSPYIQTLEQYLQTSKATAADQQEWFNTKVLRQLRSILNQFMEFVQANADDKSTCYVVTNSDSEATDRTPSLIRYSDGVPSPFDPPGIPGTPTATKVTASSINLEWTAPRLGGTVQSYQVRYGKTSEFATKQFRVKSSVTSCTISGLAPDFLHTFQVFAIGVDSSDCKTIVKGEPVEITTEKKNTNDTASVTKQSLDRPEPIDLETFAPVAQPNSLTPIREVLLERERLQTLIRKLEEQISINTMRMEELHEESEVIRKHSADINAQKHFGYSVEVTAYRKVKVAPGTHTTSCENCKFTCHSECVYEDKQRCCIMKDDHCTVCPKLCHWSQHFNAAYSFNYCKESVNVTWLGFQQRYDSAKKELLSAKAVMAENETRQTLLRVEVDKLIKKSHQCSKRLEEISLDPNQLTESEFIEIEK